LFSFSSAAILFSSALFGDVDDAATVSASFDLSELKKRVAALQLYPALAWEGTQLDGAERPDDVEAQVAACAAVRRSRPPPREDGRTPLLAVDARSAMLLARIF
jgi:hypothetical protein